MNQLTPDMKSQWALITGASSGLGVDFAHELAARGANLVLAARRVGPMKNHPHMLINNAGYGLFGEFLSQPIVRTLNMMQLNMSALTELTHTFGTDMAHRGAGRILLVASIGAYQATPSYAAYSATKAYVLLFGEALHEELKPYGVTVTVLSPGITATNFLQVSGQKPTLYQRLVMMQSRPVVQIGLRALEQGRASIVPGWLNSVTAWSNRLMPRFIQRNVAYALMKN